MIDNDIHVKFQMNFGYESAFQRYFGFIAFYYI